MLLLCCSSKKLKSEMVPKREGCVGSLTPHKAFLQEDFTGQVNDRDRRCCLQIASQIIDGNG